MLLGPSAPSLKLASLCAPLPFLLLLCASCVADSSLSVRARQLKQGGDSTSYTNSSLDDPVQRGALLELYSATRGHSWLVPTSVSKWNSNVSYCRWLGVTCCLTTPFQLVPCDGAHSVVALSLQSFGLQGSLPSDFGSDLPELTALGLVDNPLLTGILPDSLGPLKHLLWVSVLGSSVKACTDSPGAEYLPRNSCQLPPSLQFIPYLSLTAASITCPSVQLSSFESYTRRLTAAEKQILTLPYSAPVPGGVIANFNTFTGAYNCSCDDGSSSLTVNDEGKSSCTSESSAHVGRYIAAIVLVAVLPLLLVALGLWIFIKHKATLHRLIKHREEEWKKKRSRVPGTPGVTLQNGRGVVTMSDVMVTWVFTDVADSTRLWEWNPDVMDRGIDLHNRSLRAMVDEFGGHEIRNEGDSFTMSFHEACDAVRFCLKAQKALMVAKWPQELLDHESGCKITVGHLISKASAAGQGSVVLAGLRVRMGINTGMPDDIFMQDQTGLVDYKGEEYDLAGEICDLAAGGQILMGPKTFQRWNMLYGDVPDLMQNLVQELQRSEVAPASVSVGSAPNDRSSVGGRDMKHSLLSLVQQPVLRAASIQHRLPSMDNQPWSMNALLDNTKSSSNSNVQNQDYSFVSGDLSPQLPSIQLKTLQRMASPMSSHAAAPAFLVDQPSGKSISFSRSIPSRRNSVRSIGTSTSTRTTPEHSSARGSHENGERHTLDENSLPTDYARLGLKPRLRSFSRSLDGSNLANGSMLRAASGSMVMRESTPGVMMLHDSGSTASTQRDSLESSLNHGMLVTSSDRGSPIWSGQNAFSGFTQRRVSSAWGASSVLQPAIPEDIALVDEPLAHDLYHGDSWVPSQSSAYSAGPMAPLKMLVGKTLSRLRPPSPVASPVMSPSSHSTNPLFQSYPGPQSALHIEAGASDNNALFSHNVLHVSQDGNSGPRYPPASMSGHWGARSIPHTSISLSYISALWSSLCKLASKMGSACLMLLSCLRCLSCMRVMTGSYELLPGDLQGKNLDIAKSAVSIKGTGVKGTLVDMGYYEWRLLEASREDGRQNEMEGLKLYVRLMQIVPTSIAARVLLFEWPLATGPNWNKVSPGFFDAPGSSRLIFPEMRDLMDSEVAAAGRPSVSLAFSSPSGYKELSAISQELSSQVLRLHNACVRETLSTCGGYECKECNGSFMMAFWDSCAAVEWALSLQMAMLTVPWPSEASAIESMAVVVDPETHKVIFRGMRCRVGIFTGSIDRVTPHVKTGRADYFGQPVNRAARLMSAAQGGQIVCERGIMEDVVRQWRQRDETHDDEDINLPPSLSVQPHIFNPPHVPPMNGGAERGSVTLSHIDNCVLWVPPQESGLEHALAPVDSSEHSGHHLDSLSGVHGLFQGNAMQGHAAPLATPFGAHRSLSVLSEHHQMVMQQLSPLASLPDAQLARLFPRMNALAPAPEASAGAGRVEWTSPQVAPCSNPEAALSQLQGQEIGKRYSVPLAVGMASGASITSQHSTWIPERMSCTSSSSMMVETGQLWPTSPKMGSSSGGSAAGLLGGRPSRSKPASLNLKAFFASTSASLLGRSSGEESAVPDAAVSPILILGGSIHSRGQVALGRYSSTGPLGMSPESPRAQWSAVPSAVGNRRSPSTADTSFHSHYPTSSPLLMSPTTTTSLTRPGSQQLVDSFSEGDMGRLSVRSHYSGNSGVGGLGVAVQMAHGSHGGSSHASCKESQPRQASSSQAAALSTSDVLTHSTNGALLSSANDLRMTFCPSRPPPRTTSAQLLSERDTSQVSHKYILSRASQHSSQDIEQGTSGMNYRHSRLNTAQHLAIQHGSASPPSIFSQRASNASGSTNMMSHAPYGNSAYMLTASTSCTSRTSRTSRASRASGTSRTSKGSGSSGSYNYYARSSRTSRTSQCSSTTHHGAVLQNMTGQLTSLVPRASHGSASLGLHFNNRPMLPLPETSDSSRGTPNLFLAGCSRATGTTYAAAVAANTTEPAAAAAAVAADGDVASSNKPPQKAPDLKQLSLSRTLQRLRLNVIPSLSFGARKAWNQGIQNPEAIGVSLRSDCSSPTVENSNKSTDAEESVEEDPAISTSGVSATATSDAPDNPRFVWTAFPFAGAAFPIPVAFPNTSTPRSYVVSHAQGSTGPEGRTPVGSLPQSLESVSSVQMVLDDTVPSHPMKLENVPENHTFRAPRRASTNMSTRVSQGPPQNFQRHSQPQVPHQRTSLFIVGSDDNPMFLPYRLASVSGASTNIQMQGTTSDVTRQMYHHEESSVLPLRRQSAEVVQDPWRDEARQSDCTGPARLQTTSTGPARLQTTSSSSCKINLHSSGGQPFVPSMPRGRARSKSAGHDEEKRSRMLCQDWGRNPVLWRGPHAGIVQLPEQNNGTIIIGRPSHLHGDNTSQTGAASLSTSPTNAVLGSARPQAISHSTSQSDAALGSARILAMSAIPVVATDASGAPLDKAVVAECFKITPGRKSAVPRSHAFPPAVTRISYSSVRGSEALETEIQPDIEKEEEDVVPSNTIMVPTVEVNVGVWSLGAFRFKGVAELINVVQVLPLSLKHRLSFLPKGSLDKVKARCIYRNTELITTLSVQLPDVGGLASCNAMFSSLHKGFTEGIAEECPEDIADEDEEARRSKSSNNTWFGFDGAGPSLNPGRLSPLNVTSIQPSRASALASSSMQRNKSCDDISFTTNLDGSVRIPPRHMSGSMEVGGFDRSSNPGPPPQVQVDEDESWACRRYMATSGPFRFRDLSRISESTYFESPDSGAHVRASTAVLPPSTSGLVQLSEFASSQGAKLPCPSE